MNTAIACFIQLFTGVQGRWLGCKPENKQRIYFANHTSHFDFLVLWSVLPSNLRNNTRAAAASDYWTRGGLRKWLANDVFNVVLIDRENVTRKNNPITRLSSVLDEGSSLIIFPEGGRSDEGEFRQFKAGIYHLAKARPDIDLVPTYIDNANRVLPKGEFIALPIICSVTFGTATRLQPGESRDEFLKRCRQAVLECAGV